MTSIRLRRLTCLAVATALLAGACGASAETATDGVASIATDTNEASSGSVSSAADADQTAEEAALEFASCMRDGGIDFPDPTVDEDGNPTFEDAFRAAGSGDFNPGDQDFRSVTEDCQSLTDGFTFGRRQGDFDQTAIQDALLPFTDCLREEGLDVGDLTLGANGGQRPADGAGPGVGQRGAGGDPSTRILGSLGLDSEDPTTITALETCQPLFDTAFASIGPEDQ